MELGLDPRVRHALLGCDARFPADEKLVHLQSDLRLGFGQVVLFRGVGAEVEQFAGLHFVVFDPFPVPASNGARGFASLVGVMRQVPKKDTVFGGCFVLGPSGELGLAIDGSDAFAGFDSSRIEDCRKDIEQRYGRVDRSALGDLTGPSDNQRDAQATFVEVAFAGPMRTVVGRWSWVPFGDMQPAVVA